MKIKAEVIPHCCQRYKTPGDYIEDKDGVIHFKISYLRNDDYHFLILIHELIEWYLCKRAGIKIKDIDKFDMNYERERMLGKHRKDSEPGDSKKAPYRFAHRFATKVERLVAAYLAVRWEFYAKAVNGLS